MSVTQVMDDVEVARICTDSVSPERSDSLDKTLPLLNNSNSSILRVVTIQVRPQGGFVPSANRWHTIAGVTLRLQSGDSDNVLMVAYETNSPTERQTSDRDRQQRDLRHIYTF